MVFIDFQNFVNFRQFLADFWPKNCHFFADAAKNFEKKFQRKIYLVLGKCCNWPSFWYKCSLGYPPQNLFFGFLIFLVFAEILGHLWVEGAYFDWKSTKIGKNWPHRLTNGPISQKILKKSKIRKTSFVEGTLGNIYTKNWANWSIFLGLDRFSVEIFFRKFLPRQRKNGGFWAQNRPKTVKNLQNFWNQLKLSKYTSSPNLGSF